MHEPQTKIVPAKIERSIGSVSILCAPFGEFRNKDNQIVKFPSRLKVGNGFKAIADLRSQEQIQAIVAIATDARYKKVQDWIKTNLPVSTSDEDSEVDQEDIIQ